ncbi:hypothetical protein [Sorangium cellulosum]|uniref:hypothetical protein n=1 Tax=Sorangium cellulosum TaxID=56 RepID=UPI0013314D1D|nr:hypothetical protein [Sorangium cellulosum]
MAGSVEGGLLVVDASVDGTGSVFDEMVNDEFVCLNGVSHRERTYYDVRTGRAVVALRWPGSSEVHVKVEGGHVVVSGAGCNERFRLDPGAE